MRLISMVCFVVLTSSTYSVEACDDRPPPIGAVALKYTNVAFDFCPTLADISLSGHGTAAKLYNGHWWTRSTPSPSLYGEGPNGSLAITLGGAVTSIPKTMRGPGSLPLLPGNRGFFVEFEASLSDDHEDHFPALWLMPIEHNQRQEDSYPPDERGFERWLEIDVEEGGFSPGPMATAISWSGTWPNYQRLRSNPNLRNEKIDRTQAHRFGAGFDPEHLKITFWYDGKIQYVASGASVPEIARRQHFYIIMNADTRKLQIPYKLYIHRVRAFVPE
ncbi:hypothetical protein GGD65_006163 [Bradyrhizobium sp. CIR18]|uniref:hypothetical protein n=1 Tax=Bradyrhizobium sp. CIR18 TaxID=2663839 RepID=UPI001606AE65|nr:hypothetical protein [Bradyrhizobium sp. CIR18]MBB4365099.1 hypothetical protein [Bradyrhizobium sp. CIR18]